MVRTTDRQTSVLRAIDWWTVVIYIALLIFGWVSVCGASYTYGPFGHADCVDRHLFILRLGAAFAG